MQRCLALRVDTPCLGGRKRQRKSIQRESTRKNGSGEVSSNTQSPDQLAVLRQAGRNFAGSRQGCSLQSALLKFQQGAEKQAGWNQTTLRIHGCQGRLESLRDLGVSMSPCAKCRGNVCARRGRNEMSRGFGFSGKAEKLECNAARLPRHTPITRV